MYFNSKGQNDQTYDAIVIGSGISGGWAAKELCERGLKTIVLERGFDVKHMNYPTANLDDWDLPFRNRIPPSEIAEKFPKQSRTGSALDQATKKFWVNDQDHPYTEVKRFDWIRGYHVGGRSITWGRQSYRLSDLDFEANARDGFGVDWPVRYKDIAPWYDHVESFIGVSGATEGLAHLPDGKFEPEMEMNCVETHLREQLIEKFDRVMTIGRVAHITGGTKGKSRKLSVSQSMCERMPIWCIFLVAVFDPSRGRVDREYDTEAQFDCAEYNLR